MLMYTATQACAFVDLVNSDIELKGDLVFLAVADEEGFGNYGAKWLIENVPEKIKTDYLISEYGGAVMTTPSMKQKIIVMNTEKSPGWTKLTIRGESGHASMPLGVTSAIDIATNILNNIKKHPPKTIITDSYLEFIKGMELNAISKFMLPML